MPDATAERARRAQLVAGLVAEHSADSLATAALFTALADPRGDEALDLISRAVALAPSRAELAWEQRAICEIFKCSAAADIETRLKAVDPENGFIWLADLKRAQLTRSAAEVTAALARMGASARLTIHYNALEVMMVDATANRGPSSGGNADGDLATRAVTAAGVLAAVDIPPMRPLAIACRPEAFEEPGRRAACEAMVARLELSDSVLAQSMALGLQERWWPAGDPQLELLRTKRRRLDYVIAMSGQVHANMNRDMQIRIAAARRLEREEEVDRAILAAYKIPADPPPDWQDPYRAN